MPTKFVVPVPADLLTAADAAMSDSGSNDSEHDALVELVDCFEGRRPLDQLLNDAADLILEFHQPYSDHDEAWRDAMNMHVNVACHLASRPAGHPPIHQLDEAARLELLRDAIAAGWSGLEGALEYRSYFTDAVFAGVENSEEVTA